jgi:hypothetical protein
MLGGGAITDGTTDAKNASGDVFVCLGSTRHYKILGDVISFYN